MVLKPVQSSDLLEGLNKKIEKKKKESWVLASIDSWNIGAKKDPGYGNPVLSFYKWNLRRQWYAELGLDSKSSYSQFSAVAVTLCFLKLAFRFFLTEIPSEIKRLFTNLDLILQTQLLLTSFAFIFCIYIQGSLLPCHLTVSKLFSVFKCEDIVPLFFF